MKHFIDRKGREKEDSNLLVYEHFDTTFEELLKFNEFVNEGNLTKPFLQILRWVRRLHIYVIASFKHLKLLIFDIYSKLCLDVLRGLHCLVEIEEDNAKLGTFRETFCIKSVVISKG